MQAARISAVAPATNTSASAQSAANLKSISYVISLHQGSQSYYRMCRLLDIDRTARET